jgi:hypothetical protein
MDSLPRPEAGNPMAAMMRMAAPGLDTVCMLWPLLAAGPFVDVRRWERGALLHAAARGWRVPGWRPCLTQQHTASHVTA